MTPPEHTHDWHYLKDEYGGLTGGGDYEVYECSTCGKRKYEELPG